jgi:PadR family transcriptional regulator PadR
MQLKGRSSRTQSASLCRKAHGCNTGVFSFAGKESLMNTQFKKGVLELCVLSLLKRGDKYGYELADTVGKQIDVSEGTIYPLLKRLRAEGYFEVYLRESTSGPARKYYRLTQKGYDTQRLLENEWKDFTKSVSTLLGGENGD